MEPHPWATLAHAHSLSTTSPEWVPPAPAAREDELVGVSAAQSLLTAVAVGEAGADAPPAELGLDRASPQHRRHHHHPHHQPRSGFLHRDADEDYARDSVRVWAAPYVPPSGAPPPAPAAAALGGGGGGGWHHQQQHLPFLPPMQPPP